MNKEQVTEKFNRARKLVSGIDEPFQGPALEVVFRWLLDQELVGVHPAREAGEVPVRPTMQINEFLASKKLESHADKVLGIAYYYLHAKDEPVTRPEIEEAYATSRLARPQNLSDVIAKCVRKGYLVDSREQKQGKKAWQITPTGEKCVEKKPS